MLTKLRDASDRARCGVWSQRHSGATVARQVAHRVRPNRHRECGRLVGQERRAEDALSGWPWVRGRVVRLQSANHDALVEHASATAVDQIPGRRTCTSHTTGRDVVPEKEAGRRRTVTRAMGLFFSAPR